MRLLTTIFWAIVLYVFYKIIKIFFRSFKRPERPNPEVHNYRSNRREYNNIEDAKFEEIKQEDSERKET